MTSLAFARALALSSALLLAAVAAGQDKLPDSKPTEQGTVETPDNVRNKDRPPAAKTDDQAVREGEKGNPHSVDNKDQGSSAAAPPAGSTTDEQVQRGEVENPHSTLNKDRASPGAVLERLHVSNQAEIEEGRLGEQQGTSQRIKDYARMLQVDHAKADKDVLALAEKLGVTLGDQPKDKLAAKAKEETTKIRETLRGLSGADFDRSFARELESDHHKDVALVSTARKACQEPSLCSLLDQLLPVLKAHERGAHALRAPSAEGRRPR